MSVTNQDLTKPEQADASSADKKEEKPSIEIKFGNSTVYLSTPKKAKLPAIKMNRSRSMLMMAVLMLSQQIGDIQVENKVELAVKGSINVKLGEEQVFRYSTGPIEINKLTDTSKAAIEQTYQSASVAQEFSANVLKSGVSAESVSVIQLSKQGLESATAWIQEQMQDLKLPELMGAVKGMSMEALQRFDSTADIAQQRIRAVMVQVVVRAGEVLTASKSAVEGVFKGTQFTFRQEADRLTVSRNSDGTEVLSSQGKTVRSRMTDAELISVTESVKALAAIQVGDRQTTSHEAR